MGDRQPSDGRDPQCQRPGAERFANHCADRYLRKRRAGKVVVLTIGERCDGAFSDDGLPDGRRLMQRILSALSTPKAFGAHAGRRVRLRTADVCAMINNSRSDPNRCGITRRMRANAEF